MRPTRCTNYISPSYPADHAIKYSNPRSHISSACPPQASAPASYRNNRCQSFDHLHMSETPSSRILGQKETTTGYCPTVQNKVYLSSRRPVTVEPPNSQSRSKPLQIRKEAFRLYQASEISGAISSSDTLTAEAGVNGVLSIHIFCGHGLQLSSRASQTQHSMHCVVEADSPTPSPGRQSSMPPLTSTGTTS